jgi:hypothetical protein
MTNPKHPVYIVSKGRSNSMITSRSLSRMKVPHSIVVEPQDYDPYQKAIEKFKLAPYASLIVAPFSNHGDGPGRARNFAWDHSISIGATYHWVMDDNIADFYRLHENQRIRVESGVIFYICEEFVERYENVPVSGLQYRFFLNPNLPYPPFFMNTRIYSCLLIRNDCKHRWRGRYNEDTILSLDVLSDGDCTIQFNAFMQGKCATQTVKGGCTDEFYHYEVGINPQTGEAIKSDIRVDTEGHRYNSVGTLAKSKMLADIYPDVCKVVWRYDRWHHYVDYRPFKKNKLKLKPTVLLPAEPNNFGMRLITNYSE